MKLIFLGLFFCEESLKEAYKASKRVLMAPHKFQMNLLSGFEQVDGLDVAAFHVPPTGSFPVNYNKIVSKEYINGNRRQIGYLNLPALKHWIQKRKLKKLIKKQVKNSQDEDINILVYSLYQPYLQVIKSIKKKHPQLQTSLILTDPVPGRGDFDKFMKPKYIKRGNKLVSLAKSVDRFIVLTKYLAEQVDIGERPFEIIECIGDIGQIECKKTSGNERIFFYAGGVGKDFGLCELVDAFSLLPEAQLWVCGGGDAAEYVQEMSEKYSNIRYFGFVTAERVSELQNQCDYLINPRRPNGGFTKYSFPSKTVEYMMTGKPVIMYKLEGVPDEYDEYLTYVTGTNGEKLANELKQIFLQDYNVFLAKAEKARMFVLENKNNVVQAKKIINFLGR